MTRLSMTRREFVGAISTFAVALPELVTADASPRLTIPSATEPGKRLLITGTIVGMDGRTPLAGL
jgi:hypothetical protein